MSFPLNPIDNQSTTQNGIVYVYSTATNSWRRDFNRGIDRINVAGTYTSTSTNTGALTVAGGVGIGGDLWVGGQIYQNGIPVGTKVWQIVSATYTATAYDALLVDTSFSAFTITLPPNPLIGETISFIDYAGTFGTNNLTFDRNGQLILSTSTDLIVDVTYAANTLVYSDVSSGWRLEFL